MIHARQRHQRGGPALHRCHAAFVQNHDFGLIRVEVGPGGAYPGDTAAAKNPQFAGVFESRMGLTDALG